MLNLLAANIDGLEIAYIAVCILLGTAIIAAFIAQIVIAIGYWRGNRTNNSLGLSGGEYARKLLDQNGMPDVQVRVCAQTSRSERNAGCTGKKMRYYTNHFIRKPL